MAGTAVGNLLGIRLEGWSKNRITRAYPNGVRQITALSGYPDDDDLAQAIVIAEAAAAGPLDPENLARRLWDWAETNGAGIGGLTRNVLALYGGKYPQRLARNRRDGIPRPPTGVPILEASRSAWEGWRAGNGAAMRCAPIAIRWRDDPMNLVRNSIVSATPTHWDPRCGWTCALLNVALAAAIRGESPETLTPDSILEEVARHLRASLDELEGFGYDAHLPDGVSEAVRGAFNTDLDDLPCDGADSGFTLLALRIGLFVFWRASSFGTALSSVIEAGGDTDTNGAIAGALLGARFGIEGIPHYWRDRVAELRAGRPPMAQFADQLLGTERTLTNTRWSGARWEAAGGPANDA